MADFKYDCHFCGQKFKIESRFMKHNCTEMKRDVEFRTPVGQSAWMYYQTYMKTNRRMVPQPASFLNSRLYNTFIKFAHHVRKVQLPDPNAFIRFMQERGIQPIIWTNDDVYTLYLEYLDRKAPARDRANTTIEEFFKIADGTGVDVSDVFEVLDAGDVIALLRRRRISPWILLKSPKFTKFYATKTNNAEKIILESLIRPEFWVDKFSKNPKLAQLMKVYVEELNL